MDLQGSDFSDSRDSMIILSDSRDPNRVGSLKHLKKLCCICKYSWY